LKTCLQEQRREKVNEFNYFGYPQISYLRNTEYVKQMNLMFLVMEMFMCASVSAEQLSVS